MSNPHGGNLREAAEKYHLSIERIIDFSSNINPLGFPSNVKKLITNNISSIVSYPDPDCKYLKKALSHHLSVNTDNILIGNGAVELIFLIVRMLLPKRALIPVPTFSEYESAVKLVKGECLFFKCREGDNFKIRVGKLTKFLSQVDIVFICNPNNPTGFLLRKEEILFILKGCQKYNVTLVIDEAFVDFLEDASRITVVKEAIRVKNLLVVRSLTKFFALPGLRIGYLVAQKELIKKISHHQPPWSVNTFAQLVAKEIIKDSSFIERSRNFVVKNREILFKELDKIEGLKPYPSAANFILCKLTNQKINSKMLFDRLGRRGILVRNCDNFRGLNDKFIRIAVRKEQENRKLINALNECFNKWNNC